jgi:predicted short-subunit dehydrogenase-like oxidoreductase (DUF2520 family)
MMHQISISFVGAGRVAGALCKELFLDGFRIEKIVSETDVRGKSLALSCKTSWSSELVFPDTANVIIVAVPDHTLINVLNDLKCGPGTLVAHTAGSFGLDIFPEHIKHKGVFYPLQTFSYNRKISFDNLPFLIESSDDESLAILETLAESVYGKVYFVNTEQRRMLHLAAVFVCNFTNHLLTVGRDVAIKAGFPFEILTPLIKETISKAIDSGPENSQTGPAVRHDQNTIEKHLKLLSFSPELQRIYNEMTLSINEYYNKER